MALDQPADLPQPMAVPEPEVDWKVTVRDESGVSIGRNAPSPP
jgi:hypothetical protein